ncbi:hypothetical protein GCM10028808_35660 [Spirosoma migulaei]
MKIKRLIIENFKSIERIELVEPNPFTVFVGPNGSGKSNIFEALEFVNRCSKALVSEVFREFGGVTKISRRNGADIDRFHFNAEFDKESEVTNMEFAYNTITDKIKQPNHIDDAWLHLRQDTVDQFYQRFGRIFVSNEKLLKVNYQDDRSLNIAATNLEAVLKRILTDNVLRVEIFEWLELFVPGFKAVEVDDRDELHWFEEFAPSYFTKDLISDGTYNILAILAAVYQSDDKPQFLCIEEPENGLHPQVARELVDFFRIMCEERGHHIWLNTHSQSMISRLKPEEMVIVDKKQGATRIKQISKEEFKNWRMDEALLMNAFGGGLAW